MKSCFNSPFKITQEFGKDFKTKDGKYYYKDNFNMKGHNGIDLIPIDNDARIYCIFSGEVIKMYFNKFYGNRVIIWNKQKHIIETHNHLEYFDSTIKLGKILESKTLLGKMGSTGKVFGAHNHLEIAKVDNFARKINKNNGYFGYINPYPYLKGKYEK